MLFEMSPDKYSFKGVGLLIALYLTSLAFAAIAAPCVYWLVQWWAQKVPSDTSLYLASKPFDDFVDRLRWIPIIIGFPKVLKLSGLSTWGRLGVSIRSVGKKGLFIGLALSLVVFSSIYLLHYLGGHLTLKEGLLPIHIIRTVIRALCIGLFVAFIEEIVFRGLILRIFYTAYSPPIAVILGSLFFAYVHFKMPSEVWESTDMHVSIYSGAYVALWFLIGITKNFQLLPFLNLFALGLVTSLLFIRTRSLMPSIGLHAGLVFLLISSKAIFIISNTGRLAPWMGSHRITDGAPSLGLLLILATILTYWKGTNSLEVCSGKNA